jgi:lipopolysaccharide transport system ATP-binding protein
MPRVVIRAEHITKEYRLGEYGTGTLSHDINRWWAKVRGKEDPTKKIAANITAQPVPANNFILALNDVSFDVVKGEVLGIIGKNGAGKSTLLKVLSQVTVPTSGQVKVKGRVASLLEVGTGFHPELTGRENIFLNGAILGMTKSEVRMKFDEIVAFSGVEQYIDTPVKRYSSGMYVRLAFSVAAHLEPEILIVDEVLAVGDFEFQKKCLGKMHEVSEKEGRTVLFVSHNMPSVRSLCTRAILLEQGTAVLDGRPEAVIDRYIRHRGNDNTGVIPEGASIYNSGEARFVSLGISDSQNSSTTSLHYRENFSIRLDFVAGKEIHDAIFYVCITTLDGTNAVYLCTMDSEQVMYTIPQGRHTVSVAVNTHLLPGSYSLSLGLAHANGNSIDYVERALDFTVMKLSRTQTQHYPWNQSHGFTLGSAQWNMPFTKRSLR